jgi:formylglycine-generating enzyme required for sulfatase activity
MKKSEKNAKYAVITWWQGVFLYFCRNQQTTMKNLRIHTSKLFLPAVLLACLFQSCEKEEDKVSVTPKTYHIENVTDSSATIRCSVFVEGGVLEESGLCFSSTTLLPYVYNSRCIPSTASLEEFTVTLTGLSADSIYRFVAYAKMDGKIYYGAVYAFQPVDPDMASSMVLVEGGTFTMGATQEQDSVASDTEKPVHQVSLNSFKISKYEITTSQFVVFLNSRKILSTGSSITNDGKFHNFFEAKPKNIYFDADDVCWKPVSGYERTPMTNVTWYGASEYCRWAGGELPTEAQWEYAARGGQNSNETVYSGGNQPTVVAWYAANTNYQDSIEYFAQPVGKKTPNELGLYDMSGNVWEWCNDWYSTYTATTQNNPKGLSDEEAQNQTDAKKVRRGGGWADISTRQLRVSTRGSNTPTAFSGSIGFRMASEI